MIPSVKTIERMLAETLKKEHGDRAHDAAMAIRFHLEKAVEHSTNCECEENIDAALDAINLILHGYGVAAMRDNEFHGYYCDIGLLYVNMGDTYCPTVCYDTRKDQFYVTSWGDMVEGDSKRFDI